MAAVTSGGRSEAADELLKEALLAAGNGSGSGGDGDGEEDLEEIRSVGSFLRHAADENRKLWYLAGPAIITSITQYSLGAITQVFAGHLTTLELDAISTENNVIAGLAFGIMLGMGSALETLCGQAYGAKQLHMLGVYLQRSWVILNAMAVLMLPLYLFATPILCLFHQDAEIADLAGRLALYMIPQLFAYAFNFPIQKFLQAQSKVMAMAAVSAVALAFHVALSWVLVGPCGWGSSASPSRSTRPGPARLHPHGLLPRRLERIRLARLLRPLRLRAPLPGIRRHALPGVLVLHVPDRHRRQPGERSGGRCRSLHLHEPVRVADHGVLRIQRGHQAACGCPTSWAPGVPARPSWRSWWCSCRRWPSGWPSSSSSWSSATSTARPSRTAPRWCAPWPASASSSPSRCCSTACSRCCRASPSAPAGSGWWRTSTSAATTSSASPSGTCSPSRCAAGCRGCGAACSRASDCRPSS